MSFAGFKSSLAQCEQTEGLAIAKRESRRYFRPSNSKTGTSHLWQIVSSREKNGNNSLQKTDKECYSLIFTGGTKRGMTAPNEWYCRISGKKMNMDDIKTDKHKSKCNFI